jgi:regulatory protein
VAKPRRRAARARQADSLAECRQRAIRLLTIRGRSREELSRALELRGFSRETVAKTVESVEAAGLLDERAALESFLASRRARYGRERIRRELEHRGFPAEMVAGALSSLSPEEERRKLERLVRRLPGTQGRRGPEPRRLRASLLRRGFAADLVRELLSEEDPS